MLMQISTKFCLYLLWSPQLLTLVLLAPGGQGKVLQAFDYLRTVADEPKRLQMLVLALTNIQTCQSNIPGTKYFIFQEKVCTSSKFENTSSSSCLPVAMVM